MDGLFSYVFQSIEFWACVQALNRIIILVQFARQVKMKGFLL